MAHPRPYLDGRNPARLLDALAALAREDGIERFILGLPRRLDGREGPPARRARRFGEKLEARTGVVVEMVDEWLSTKQARERLREQGLDDRDARQRVDSAAAAVVLQAWMDGRTEER